MSKEKITSYDNGQKTTSYTGHSSGHGMFGIILFLLGLLIAGAIYVYFFTNILIPYIR